MGIIGKMVAATPSVRSTSQLFKAGSIPQFTNHSLRFDSKHVISTRPLVCSSMKLSQCTKAYRHEVTGKATSPASHKIAVIGSPHGIGNELSAALKKHSRVSQLNFYSIGGLDHLKVCLDATHSMELKGILKDVDVVVICPRPESDRFIGDALIVKACIEAVADHCPDAFILIESRYLNSMIPFSSEILKKRGMYDPKKLFGLLTPETELAKAFVYHRFAMDLDLDFDVFIEDLLIPIVGGHSSKTTLPLFSKTKPEPPAILKKYERQFWMREIGHMVSFGDSSESLVLPYSPGPLGKFEVRGAEIFVVSLLRALDGSEDVFQTCFVQSNLTVLPFFGSRVKLGKKGVESFVESDLKDITEDEAESLTYLLDHLFEDIYEGIEFAHTPPGGY